MLTTRPIVLLLALALFGAAPALAQTRPRKPEPWYLTVTQRVDLSAKAVDDRAVGARFVNHLTAGYLIDALGHVVTRLVNLDPTAAEHNISVTTSTGRILRAEFVGLDAPTGLAVLRVPELRGMRPIPAVAPPELEEGEAVTILSPSYKLRSLPAPIERNAMPPAVEVVSGRVTFSKPDPSLALWGVRFVVESPQFDASRDLSLLEDADGRPVGLVKYFSPRVGQVIGLRFLHDEVASRVVAAGGNVAAGWLGADGVSSGGAARGVRLETVVPNGPADLAGLRRGDVVVGFREFEIRNPYQLASAVTAVPAGTTVELRVRRGDETLTVAPVLGALPLQPGQPVFTNEMQIRQAQLTQFYLATLLKQRDRAKSPEERERIQAQIDQIEGVTPAPAAAPVPDGGLDRIGLRGETLTAQLAAKRGVEGGVLVTEVKPESVAARAGLEADDVIVEVDGARIADAAALRAALARAAGAGAATASLAVRRGAAPLALTLSVEALR